MPALAWEYTHDDWPPADPDLDDHLNAYGKQGWQLVTVITVGAHMHRFYFRRPARLR